MKKQLIEEYFQLLKSHDWYYEFSEDYSVFKKGSDSLRDLSVYAAENKTAGRMFDAFKEHYFSGQAFGTKRTPKPKIEDFLRKGAKK